MTTIRFNLILGAGGVNTEPSVLAAVRIASGVLLLIAGAAKLHDSRAVREALRTSGVPSSKFVAALIALIEITSGLLLLSWVGKPAPLLASALYLAFCGFLVQARMRALPIRSCGCFGRDDTPVSIYHVVVTAFLSVALLFAAVTGTRSSLLSLRPNEGDQLTFLVEVTLLILVLYALLVPLPALSDALRTAMSGKPRKGQMTI